MTLKARDINQMQRYTMWSVFRRNPEAAAAGTGCDAQTLAERAIAGVGAAPEV